MSQEITKEQIAAFDTDFSAQRANRVAMNAVTNNGLLASAIRREAAVVRASVTVSIMATMVQ